MGGLEAVVERVLLQFVGLELAVHGAALYIVHVALESAPRALAIYNLHGVWLTSVGMPAFRITSSADGGSTTNLQLRVRRFGEFARLQCSWSIAPRPHLICMAVRVLFSFFGYMRARFSACSAIFFVDSLVSADVVGYPIFLSLARFGCGGETFLLLRHFFNEILQWNMGDQDVH